MCLKDFFGGINVNRVFMIFANMHKKPYIMCIKLQRTNFEVYFWTLFFFMAKILKEILKKSEGLYNKLYSLIWRRLARRKNIRHKKVRNLQKLPWIGYPPSWTGYPPLRFIYFPFKVHLFPFKVHLFPFKVHLFPFKVETNFFDANRTHMSPFTKPAHLCNCHESCLSLTTTETWFATNKRRITK